MFLLLYDCKIFKPTLLFQMAEDYHGYCAYLFDHGKVTDYNGEKVKLVYGIPFRMTGPCVLHCTTLQVLDRVRPHLLHLIQKYGARDREKITHRERKEVAIPLGPVVGLLRFILPSLPTDAPLPRRASLTPVTANLLVSASVSIEDMHGLTLWHYCYLQWLLHNLGFCLKEMVMNFTVVHCTLEEEERVRHEMQVPITTPYFQFNLHNPSTVIENMSVHEFVFE